MKCGMRATTKSLLLAAGVCCCPAVLAEEPFYRQLIDLQQPAGYSPTRTFTVIVDGERGNRLVASDDPNLQFNLAWMDQYHPDYRHRKGGGALGLLVRSYLRQLYDDGREQRAVSANYVPDGDVDVGIGNFGGEMEYHLRVKDDEVNLRLEYLY